VKKPKGPKTFDHETKSGGSDENAYNVPAGQELKQKTDHDRQGMTIYEKQCYIFDIFAKQAL
jgi:hypothetical protein